MNVLYMYAFDTMGFKTEIFKSMHTPLMGFARETVFPEGSIELPLIVGEVPNRSIVFVNFFMIKSLSAYNAILGRPTFKTLKATTLTYHLMINFITKGRGVGSVRGDQYESRQCYAITLHDKDAHSGTLSIFLKSGHKPLIQTLSSEQKFSESASSSEQKCSEQAWSLKP